MAVISTIPNTEIPQGTKAKGTLKSQKRSFREMQRMQASQFAWADPALKPLMDVQLLPIMMVVLCQIVIKASNNYVISDIAIGWGMYLPPLYLVCYLMGTCTNYRPTYAKVTLSMLTMGMTVYSSISVIYSDIIHLLHNLTFLQENANPLGLRTCLWFTIWTPWTVIFFCNITLIVIYATFAFMSLVDLYKFNPRYQGPSTPVQHFEAVVVVDISHEEEKHAKQVV